jgi:hypothetical protein
MPLKDHYKTLGIAANAGLSDVKKAYRTLAHKYHPDKNPDNNYSASHFREIQEAYKVLGDERSRKQYDEERYFAGLSGQKEPAKLSPEWILTQAKKLRTHMSTLDSYTMNHRAVSEYVLLLLSDSHIAVLQYDHELQVNRQIIEEVIAAIKRLDYRYYPAIVGRLTTVAGTDNTMHQAIALADEERRKRMRGDKYLPLIIVIITLVLCLLMYLYSSDVL